jgi:tetratricopeptide (TPR) repeat protein
MIKPQAWSKDDQAIVLEFQAASNHTGYYQFRTAKSPAYQVPAAKVVTVILFPESPVSIMSGEQRAALQKTMEEFAAQGRKFPAAARILDQALAPLKADAAKYDAGNIKEDSQWVLRTAYYQKKAAALADLIKPEILSAPKIKDLDLATDNYFVGLQELARTEPSVRPVLAGIQSLYDSRVRKEERADLLRQLNSGGITLDQASELVKKLKALLPQEDVGANLFVQSWDTATEKATELTKQIQAVQVQFEASGAEVADASGSLSISPELAASLKKMSESVREFRAGSPPAVIRVPLALADAMLAFGDNLPVLEKQIKARELFDAKAILDPLVRQAVLIGPKTSASLAGIQKQVNGNVGKFLVLRDEGKMLADNDKIEEALKKYEEAYAIVPAKDIAAQIEALKKQ